MAFIFPDPSELQAVTNPMTGVNYVWKEDLGKWVVASQTSALSEAIWEGTNPPPSEQEDDYQLWYNTDTLELYFRYCDENATCAWVPTSVPLNSIEDIQVELDATGAAVATARLETAENYQEIVTTKTTVSELESSVKLLQAEIEQLAPSLERGVWLFDDDNNFVGGEYGLNAKQTQETYDAEVAIISNELQECMDAADGDTAAIAVCNREYTTALDKITPVETEYWTDDWKLCTKVKFSAFDNNANNHSFKDVTPGQTLDMVCENGSGYMIAEVKKVTTGMWYEDNILEVTPIKSVGVASGPTRVKIFTLDNTVGSDALDSYVKKTGDKMSGILETTKPIWIRPDNEGAKGANNMLVVNQASGKSGSIARFQQGGTDVIKVQDDKTTSFEHNRVINVGSPAEDKDATTKKYVDDLVAENRRLTSLIFGRRFKHGYNQTDPRDKDGYCYFGSNYMYVSTIDLDNLNFEIICDHYPDTAIVGSGQKLPIIIYHLDAHGGWQLIGSGHWPGQTDCRDDYIYIKNLAWTKTKSWVKGGEYRVKLSPFW